MAEKAVTNYQVSPGEKKLALLFILVGFAHLLIGVVMGLLQGLEHAGLDLFPFIPALKSYYQALSIHGVFNVLLFTTFFIVGFLGFAASHGFERPLASVKLAWVNFWLMLAGALLTDWALLTNQASVLFTSYAPMKAHPTYYIGLAIVVVGTLLLLLNLVLTYLAWRRERPGERIPLLPFGALVTMIMWGMASVGVVVEFVFFLIPWSLGWIAEVDPLLTRTFFWESGHPIVYFWLLPAYMSWYFLLPRQAGGKLFSEPLARLAFLLFIPLSLPVGFHHQFLDPGVSQGWKAIHAVLTFGVFIPSMMTAFTVLASVETGGRARGGQGLFGWIRTLPWGDPSFTGQALAMVLFALGGASGLINASYTLNLEVHNTLFIPGHFHLTVGTAVALTFMAMSYWLIPHLTGRDLWSRRLGLVQVVLWFVGMTFMSRGMSWAGILGAPRRTMLGASPYLQPTWDVPLQLVAIGGAILTTSAVLYYWNLVATLASRRRTADVEVPLAEPLEGRGLLPRYLDRFAPWVVSGALLVLIGYGPTLVRLLTNMQTVAAPLLRPF
ncbi:cbb3-type cytochrome c oxidase subunit I [Limnochorda pilosa]|uniref:Cytochrome C oxidase subunit I n=1 Tax=Limnochorda pilosa TaxID=1555112 RepID=A0A0K2SLC5_LIMPI|nr:cbb3-type cytochrome c oxidase subunit I [Limnochorda pilosa]BAS27802.1 cytochrome C oxidase subunit I [Limnochorda pilosa]